MRLFFSWLLIIAVCATFSPTELHSQQSAQRGTVGLGSKRTGSARQSEISEEIAQLKEAIERNERETAQAHAARERLAEERKAERARQEALEGQVKQIIDQIKAYEQQMGQEIALADRAEADAAAADRLALYYAAQNTKSAKVTAIMWVMTAGTKRQAAQNHRRRAQQLLAKIQELTHELYVLTKE